MLQCLVWLSGTPALSISLIWGFPLNSAFFFSLWIQVFLCYPIISQSNVSKGCQRLQHKLLCSFSYITNLTWSFSPFYSWTSWRRQQMQLTPSSWQTLSTWRYSRTSRTTRPCQGRSAWLTRRPGSTWWVWAEEVPTWSIRKSGEERLGGQERLIYEWGNSYQYSKTNSALHHFHLRQACSCLL